MLAFGSAHEADQWREHLREASQGDGTPGTPIAPMASSLHTVGKPGAMASIPSQRESANRLLQERRRRRNDLVEQLASLQREAVSDVACCARLEAVSRQTRERAADMLWKVS